MPDGSAGGISVAGRPPPRADAESVAFTDSGTDSGAHTRAGTTRGGDLAGTMLYADSTDAVADAGSIGRTKRCAECARFSGPAADWIAYTDAVAIHNAIACANAIAAGT